MTRIVIFEQQSKFFFRVQERRYWFWQTSFTSPGYATMPVMLAVLSSFYFKAAQAKLGSKYTRQQRRAAARMIAKVAG